MGQLFSMDNKFFLFMSRIIDVIILNMIFISCCIPVVTIGASISAMYSVTMKMAKNEESYIIKEFFRGFKENFKDATIIWLICVVSVIILYVDMNFVVNLFGNTLGNILKIIFSTVSIVLVLIATYIFPLVAKFKNTIKNYILNSLFISMKYLKISIVILFINIMPFIFIMLGGRIFSHGIMLYTSVGFAGSAFINSYMFNNAFMEYI